MLKENVIRVWKKHPEHDMMVSTDGLIRKKGHRGMITTAGSVGTKGYLTVRPTKVFNEGVKKSMQNVHRLVLETFSPRTEADIKLNRNMVNHKNCIVTDNRLENLEWTNNSENVKHAYDNGKCEKQRKHCRELGKNHLNNKKTNKNFKASNKKRLGSYNSLYNPITYNGITYTSIKQAAKELNISLIDLYGKSYSIAAAFLDILDKRKDTQN